MSLDRIPVLEAVVDGIARLTHEFVTNGEDLLLTAGQAGVVQEIFRRDRGLDLFSYLQDPSEEAGRAISSCICSK